MGIAQRICKNQFKLSKSGETNVEDALSKLSSFKSVGNLLWFGFGHRHLVRVLATTEEGMTIVALCGALAEMFHQDQRAEILGYIANFALIPDEHTPSLMEWRMLANSCAGILANTLFPQRVATFLRLAGIEEPMYVATADSIANVLLAIGNVSTGSLRSIIVDGPAEIAFVAAVAEWIFGLRISIEKDGKVFYCNCPLEIVQAEFIFKDPEWQIDRASRLSNQPLQAHPVWSLVIEEIFTFRQTSYEFYGRAPWSDTKVGIAFRRVIKSHCEIIAAAIGSAARIYEGIVQGEKPEVSLYWDSFFESSYGTGFIEGISEMFPDLHKLRSRIETSYMVSFEEACSTYERISTDRSSCGCRKCISGIDARPKNVDCTLDLMAFVITLHHSLAGVDVFSGLHPSVAGLDRLFRRFLGSENSNDVSHSPSNCTFNIWLRDRRLDLPALFNRHGNSHRPEIRLKMILDLFGNGTYPNFDGAYSSIDGQDENQLAVSTNGVCVYYDCLRFPSDDSELCSLLHVIPGVIDFKGKLHNQVRARPLELRRRNNSLTLGLSDVPDYQSMETVLVEKVEELEVMYMFRLKTVFSKPHERLMISPVEFVASITRARQILFCEHRRNVERKDPETTLELPNCSVVFTKMTGPRRWAAMKLLSQEFPEPGLRRPEGLDSEFLKPEHPYPKSTRKFEFLLKERVCDSCFLKTVSANYPALPAPNYIIFES